MADLFVISLESDDRGEVNNALTTKRSGQLSDTFLGFNEFVE